jgi:GT2 family glycosyltransferase
MLENVSVVIPTARDHIHTTDTLPSGVEVIVRRDEGLNVARNAGVRAAENDWIVIADDDIDFPTETVVKAVERMDTMTLSGLADFPPLRWIIGRLMIFHRDLWETVGGFDEDRHHGGDTDFAIRVEKAGGDVIQLDREAVPHYDEETGEGMNELEHLEWIAYLVRRHPKTFSPVAARIIGQKALKALPSTRPSQT